MLGRRPKIVDPVVPGNPNEGSDLLSADRLDVFTVEHRGEPNSAVGTLGAVRALDLGRDELAGTR
jgi:hypothetical protein